MQNARRVEEQKVTGLGWDPQSMWRQQSLLGRLTSRRAMNESLSAQDSAPATAGIAGDYVQTASLAAPVAVPAPVAGDSSDRKLVRNASLDLVVKRPAESAEQVRALAQRIGGYLENSQVSGDQDAPNASLTVRVPAARFEEARAEIRKLGLRIESEKVDAQDVTRQYVDQDARLRNLRAEEEQLLGILKRASTVSDTLEVSEKLNDLRGQIEQQQSEFEALSKQIETVAITVSLRAEADAQVLGLHWRPLYRLKIAAREGLDSLGDYLATMASLAFSLPTILLWLATILMGAALGWRILRWCVRVLFDFPKSAAIEKGAN
jgi:hypothetical protein